MDIFLHYAKNNMFAVILAAVGIGVGGYFGASAAGGFTFGGVLTGLAGAALAGGLAFVAGNMIDSKRVESSRIPVKDASKPLVSQEEPAPGAEPPTPDKAQEVTYKIQMTPAMWDGIRDYTKGMNLKDHEKSGLKAAEMLAKNLTAEMKGKKLGDTFTVTSIKVPPYVDEVSLEGKDVKVKVKDGAIDFSHPDTIAGMDNMANVLYQQRGELFDKVVDKLGIFKRFLPTSAIDGIKKDIIKGDIRNPYHNVTPDQVSSLIGRNYLSDMARDHGIGGLKKVLKTRLMRFTDPERSLDEARIDKVVNAIAREYETNAALKTMSEMEAMAYFANNVPEIHDIEPIRYPTEKAGETYSLKKYVLELVTLVHKPVSEGLVLRAKAGGAATDVTVPKPVLDMAPPAKPVAVDTTIKTLGQDFLAGKFNDMPVSQNNNSLPTDKQATLTFNK